ncbi:GAK system XXXCH domain-containing protein [Pseudodesulfovibrio sp. zrk46]|uniref:GAK system XXXCH domain-containing protein n=1 Tax=Pseudodesulfovibrio sp. zrk46 TaxID=2725288 RepID=UPI001449B75B|nr:GAK system XXXCH domain-containing protein [Pseudodesulfovibrio sp. zrk46]QJB57446.1 GAK system XXXCH domain-containing protein [Pseudodesulfovibrio sp. zrk46]
MKINKFTEISDIAAFLRDFADAIENGGANEFACVDDFKKIKIVVKKEFGQIQLKAKVRTNETCVEPSITEDAQSSAPVKPDYKILKKQMRSSFKVLVKMIHDNQLPPKEAVDSFLKDSALMVTYPGYGDEYYESYSLTCEALKKAFEANDMDALHKAVDALIHEKSRCHAQYD